MTKKDWEIISGIAAVVIIILLLWKHKSGDTYVTDVTPQFPQGDYNPGTPSSIILGGPTYSLINYNPGDINVNSPPVNVTVQQYGSCGCTANNTYLTNTAQSILDNYQNLANSLAQNYLLSIEDQFSPVVATEINAGYGQWWGPLGNKTDQGLEEIALA